MPILRVSLWSGRTKGQKAELAKALTDTHGVEDGPPPRGHLT